MPGILNNYVKAANQVIVSNVLVSIGLSTAIAASQTKKIRWWVPFSTGATGGMGLQIVVPAGGTIFNATIKLFNVGAGTIVIASQAASALFNNALANAATHWVEVEVTIVNGATAGTVDLQMRQNTTDALTLTVLRGAGMEEVAV